MGYNSLPSLPYADGIRKHINLAFGGYDHNIGAGDGTIWDEENMTSDYYPVMATRPLRYITRTLTSPKALFALNGLWWVDQSSPAENSSSSQSELGGTKLYHDGTQVTTVICGEKQFAGMGKRLIIFPDKIVVNADTNAVSNLGASVTDTCVIKDGTYAGEAADANTIKSTGRNWSLDFKVGDAVTITGGVGGVEQQDGDHPRDRLGRASLLREHVRE